jgi:hypothetical protein|nr:MAG TPA: Protein of unknown function (DUF723) [Caudoviricetes sp.]
MFTKNIYVDLKQVEDNLDRWGYECLDNEYINAKTKLNLIDSKGYRYYSTYDSLKGTNGGCDYVSCKNPYSIENIKLWISKNRPDYDILSDKFINGKTKLKFYDKIYNEEFMMTWNNFSCSMQDSPTRCQIKLKEAALNNRLKIDDVKRKVNNRIPTIRVISNEWNTSLSKIECTCSVCNNKFLAWYGNLMKGEGCPTCGLRKGDKNSNWKGGITPLYNNMRGAMISWRLDSYEKYNHKCDITGKKLKSNVIHHCHNYCDILQETLEILNIDVRSNIGEYSEEELESIKDKCLELHYKYGLGVCLTEELHKEFHSIYGNKNNTLRQYDEFKRNKLKEVK